MGAKKKRDAPKKITPEAVSEVVASLADKDATAMSRVRRVAEALELEKFVDVLDTGGEVMSAVRVLLRREGGRYTLEEAAAKAGLPPEEFRQLNLACGFADPGPDAAVFTDEDVEILQLFKGSTEIFGEDLAMQNVRVIGHAMSRVADAFISSFATMIGRQSRESGAFTVEDLDRANETAVAMLPSAVRAMDVLLRRHMELKSRPDFLMGEDWEGVDAVERAIGFCDLVGYTALAQQISDNRLAVILRAFETTASDLITEHGANVVKLIGDEIMFVAPDANTAAGTALGLAERFGRGDELLPPVRCGVTAGRVIVREGDFHGPVVNLAARIVKLAPPGGVLVPRALLAALRGRKFEDAGSPDLKGFEEPVELVRITS